MVTADSLFGRPVPEHRVFNPKWLHKRLWCALQRLTVTVWRMDVHPTMMHPSRNEYYWFFLMLSARATAEQRGVYLSKDG